MLGGTSARLLGAFSGARRSCFSLLADMRWAALHGTLAVVPRTHPAFSTCYLPAAASPLGIVAGEAKHELRRSAPDCRTSCKNFGALRASTDDVIDPELRGGRNCTRIIGPNGAGKITLIHQICGTRYNQDSRPYPYSPAKTCPARYERWPSARGSVLARTVSDHRRSRRRFSGTAKRSLLAVQATQRLQLPFLQANASKESGPERHRHGAAAVALRPPARAARARPGRTVAWRDTASSKSPLHLRGVNR